MNIPKIAYLQFTSSILFRQVSFETPWYFDIKVNVFYYARKAQMAEQWMQQKVWEHNNNTGARWGQAILHSLAKSDQPTSWRRQSFWLREKRQEIEGKRVALRARRIWLQQEKAKYGLP